MTSKRRRPVVAIDGPAGAGKTTVAREVARALGFVLVDTGALYRAVALAARREGLEWSDADGCGALAWRCVREGRLVLETGEGATPTVRLEGVALGGELRSPEMAQGASLVSAHPGVRAALLDLQRQFGAEGGVVLEGRDIGTVVFPDAEVKVFLTATDETRAERRHREQVSRGLEQPLDSVLAEVRRRDAQDSQRALAPLKPAEDAWQLDSSGMDVAAVVAAIVERVRGL